MMTRDLSLVTGASSLLSAGEVVTTESGSLVSPAGNRLPGFKITGAVVAVAAGGGVTTGALVATDVAVGDAGGGAMLVGAGVADVSQAASAASTTTVNSIVLIVRIDQSSKRHPTAR